MSLLIGRALLVGLALGLSIAVVALAARGAGLGLIVAWLVAIVVTWRWFHPALLVYVFLLPLSLDYVGVAFPKIFEVNGSRLLSLLFLPGFLLALAADPAGVRALLRPLPLAVGLFWLTVSVTPLWSAGQVTLTGAIRDGLVDGIDFVLPCLVVLASLRRPAQARALVIALLAGGLLLVGVGSWEFATGANPFVQLRPLLQGGAAWAELLRRGGLPRIEAGFGGPLSLGRYLAMLAPLAMWLSVGSERQRWRWAWAVVAAALALGVLMTLSAGPAVVLGLGLLFGLGLGWRACLPSLLLIGLTAGTFLLLLPTSPEVREVAGAWVSLETPVSAETRHNLSFRFQVLELARYGLEHSPLLGYGNYGSIPVLFEEQDIINTYAVYLLKNGLLGLAAYLGVFAALLLTVGRLARVGGPVGRLAWVLGAVVLAQMVGLLSISPGRAGVSGCSGWSWAWLERYRRRNRAPER